MFIEPEEVMKMTNKITTQQIIEHHLNQNVGQKLTPHLIVGLSTHIMQNLSTAGLLIQPEVVKTVGGEQQ